MFEHFSPFAAKGLFFFFAETQPLLLQARTIFLRAAPLQQN